MRKPNYTLVNADSSTKLVSPDVEALMLFLRLFPAGQHAEWRIRCEIGPWMSVPDFLRDQAPASVPVALDPEAEDRRLHPRHALRVQVTIFTGSRSFTTYSENVSSGGILLERTVPPTMRAESCRVVLMTDRRDQMIELKGRVLAREQEGNRIAFIDPSAQAIEALTRWIQDGVSRARLAA